MRVSHAHTAHTLVNYFVSGMNCDELVTGVLLQGILHEYKTSYMSCFWIQNGGKLFVFVDIFLQLFLTKSSSFRPHFYTDYSFWDSCLLSTFFRRSAKKKLHRAYYSQNLMDTCLDALGQGVAKY